MAREQGARTQMAIAFESTYGTAPASGYTFVPYASTTLSSEQPLINNELLGFGRDPLAPQRDAITVDGNVVVPVDAHAIGFWLKALLGSPTTTGTTPKVHTFVSGSYSLPSLAIEKQMPTVPRFEMFTGVRANSMSIELQRSGLLQATVELIGQDETAASTTQAGTPSAITLTRFGHFNGSISRNGTALGNVVSGSLTYSNNLDRVETIRSDGKIDGADPTIASLTGQMVMRFADTTLLDQAINGTASSLAFSWVINPNTSLVITAHSVTLPVPRRAITGPGGIQIELNWQAALATSPARMMTAVLTNSVASY